MDAYLGKPDGYFDAVLMDVMMPEMDGYEATRAIRESGRGDARTVAIAAMTANAFDDDRRKSAEAGMNLHLSKPISAQTLVSTLAGLRR